MKARRTKWNHKSCSLSMQTAIISIIIFASWLPGPLHRRKTRPTTIRSHQESALWSEENRRGPKALWRYQEGSIWSQGPSRPPIPSWGPEALSSLQGSQGSIHRREESSIWSQSSSRQALHRWGREEVRSEGSIPSSTAVRSHQEGKYRERSSEYKNSFLLNFF